MNLTTRVGNPLSKEGIELLTESYVLMSSLYPAEDNHAFSIEEFKADNIHFIIAEKNQIPCGCGAIAFQPLYGELKSIFVKKNSRGLGIGKLIVTDLEKEAKGRQIKKLNLETGADLSQAIQLYTLLGFKECGPFGKYKEGPHSLFMTKVLS